MPDDEIEEVVHTAANLGVSGEHELKQALSGMARQRTGLVPRHHQLDRQIQRALEAVRVIRDKDGNYRTAD